MHIRPLCHTLSLVALVNVAAAQSPIGIFEGQTDVGRVRYSRPTMYDAQRQSYVVAGSGRAMGQAHILYLVGDGADASAPAKFMTYQTITASWDVTSDSLACWLATRLGAATLVLVKSAPVPAGQATAEALAATSLVDAAFPALARRFAGSIRVLHRDREFPGSLGAKPGGCRVAR